MKKKTLIIGLAVLACCITAYGFMTSDRIAQKECEAKCKAACGDPAEASNDTTGTELAALFYSPENAELDLVYSIRHRYTKPLTEEQAQNAADLSDLIPHYPSKWIDKYHYTSVSVREGGEYTVAKGKDSKLTEEQREVVKNVKPGQEIKFTVEYVQANEATKEPEDHRMDLSMTIVPMKEASWLSPEEMATYLKEKSDDVVSSKNVRIEQQTAIDFTINSEGKAESLELKSSSGFEEIDQAFMEIIRDMPAWDPALDNEGNPIEQDFVLFFGKGGC